MNNANKEIAEVVLPLPMNKVLHYFVPEQLRDETEPVKRVLVPLANRKVIGYLVGFSAQTEQKKLKNILQILDAQPLFAKEFIRITQWIADYYFCSWGEAIHTLIPFKLRGQRAVFDAIVRDAIINNSNFNFLSTSFIPTKEQQECLELIRKSINQVEFKVFLLYGVGGSGKTELYLKSIDFALNKKKQIIFLVPEIFFIKDTLVKLQGRFKKEKIVVFHSQMSEIQRYNSWLQIKNGEADIVIGTRSAIFVPFTRLGLIIIDDEQNISYKQEQKPMYHVNEVAIKRAEFSKAVVMLGSNTPSLASYYKAQIGKYELLELAQSIGGKPLPNVEIIDMKREVERKNKGMFSNRLKEAIREKLEKREQIIIFLNRRGYANFAICKKCGLVLKCPHCDIAVSYHLDVNQLQCHYCGYKERLYGNNSCPDCRSPLINYLGMGTQKVESEIKKLFPQIRTMRMDFDTIKKESIDKMIIDFNKGKADILIGTQAILKCSVLPRVSLIGILLADIMLNIPDFHSAEYTYSLLTQLTNIAQRSNLPFELIIQTYNPSHYVILALKEHNYKEFYEKEIEFRKELGYPPFSRLVNIIIKGKEEEKVSKIAEELGDSFPSVISKLKSKASILGPSPAALFRLRGFYRWQILIKSEEDNLLRKLINEVILNNKKFPKGVKVSIDADPLNVC